MTRDAANADQLGPVRIKAGSRVVISPWVLHRHEKLWERPAVFDPERAISPRRQTVDRFAYLPFGAGPRICIGASFALQQATIILETVIRDDRLESGAGHDDVPLQRVSLRPEGGLPMRLLRRSAQSAR